MNPHPFYQFRSSSRTGGSLTILLIALVVLLAVGAGFWLWSPTHQPSPAAPVAASVDELDVAQHSGPVESQPAAPRSSVPIRKQADSPGATQGAEEKPDAAIAASPEAQETIGRLAQLDFSNKPLTADQALSVKQDLQRLTSQGTAAIPAIRQFLQQNKDISLDEIKGGSPVGFDSLRTGLFDALERIGGTQAQSTLDEVLKTTADPREIALAAQHLEQMAPGQYHDDVLKAARETLAQVADSKSKVDVGPLFQVLQTYGDSNVIPELQQNASSWQYYSTMALAGLPDGQGIRALIQQTQASPNAGPANTANNTFALQMLAQMAPQYPEASAALVDEAKSGQIPDRAWRRIAEALAGDQYQFVKDANTDMATLMRTTGVKTYHIGSTEENFYSVPLSASASAAEVTQRQALLDQLIAAVPNGPGADALQKAKTQLAAAQPH